MHVNSMKFNLTDSMHLKEIVTRIVFLRLIYVVVYSIVNVLIENIKIKAMFNSKAETNCMFKRLINTAQLFVRQNIIIIIINIVDERARFFNVCEIIFISINNITISISVFVIKRSDHELFLKRFFQRVARINSINMNNELLKMILHSLNKEKWMNFLKMLVKYISNKEEKFVFAMKFSNV